MKNPFYRILSYLCIGAFFLYWSAIFILAMPSNHAKKIIMNKAPRFRNIFGTTWRLFTPPHTFSDRLYFIVRNIEGPGEADTIEVLENIALQKQYNAPFNQTENVIDHLVNNNVLNIKVCIWSNKKKPAEGFPETKDPSYIPNAVAAVAYNKSYIASLATLKNYCVIVLKQKKIDTSGKEVKILIAEKKTRPFNQLADTNLVEKESLVFETPYIPFSK